MARFGNRSKKQLATCHEDIQAVLNEAIKDYDFSILEGHRTQDKQESYYAIGRTTKLNSGIITNCDGVKRKSRHQSLPSIACDIAPYPIDWSDIPRFQAMAQVVLKAAEILGIDLEWGGHWKSPIDYPHFQLRN